ncbi:hypothetical protein ABZ329_29315 [Streptomyces rubiginosohelvolus]|uniref:hypothetical protein n=1 Tax=Streptomyces rubiginosohelvolus TaxID=67362 RepID=UPI0034051C5B
MNQPTAGERILAFLDTVHTEQEQALAPLVGLGTCPDWGHCQPECTHQFGINDAEAKLRRVAAERKIVDLHRPIPCESFGCDCGACCATCRWTNADESGDPARWGEAEQCVYPCPTIVALAEGHGWTEGGR